MALKAEMLLARPFTNIRQNPTPPARSYPNKDKQVTGEAIRPTNHNASTSNHGMTKPTKQVQNTTGTNNPYARPTIGKCFKCGEPGHRSNECRARKSVNLVDYDDEHEEEVEYNNDDDLENAEIADEEGEQVTCVIQRLLYTPKQEDLSQ